MLLQKVGITVFTALLVASAAFGQCCASNASCAISAIVPDNTLTQEEKEAGWRLLFDGETLNGWGCTDTNPEHPGWVIDNEAIHHNVKGGGMVYTKERFGDFELKIDFMVAPYANSGIFFRWDNLADPVQTGIEMQVLDPAAASAPQHSCGAIYDVLPPSEQACKPAMEWNTAIIRASGKYISVTMNGKRIINMNLDHWKEPGKNPDGTPNKFRTAYKDMKREGHIGLQAHGGKVWYKNIKIRPL